MSTYEKKKGGTSILGIILGIVGAAAGLILPWIGGVIGAAISGILALAAILLGIRAMKNSGKGRGAITCGVIAIILAILMTTTSIGLFTKLRDEAKAREDVPLVAEFASQPYLGFVGMIMNVPRDKETQDEFTKQMDLMMKEITDSSKTAK